MSLWVLVACGPKYSEEIRFTWEVRKDDNVVEKDGIKIEHILSQNINKSFFSRGKIIGLHDMQVTGSCKNSEGNSYTVNGWLPTETMVIVKLQITNNTDKVIRLNNSVIRMFDPAGNQHEPVDKGHIKSEYENDIQRQATKASVDCTDLIQKGSSVGRLKLLEKNTELLPNLTWTGYVVFDTQSDDVMKLPGNWKLAIYDVPTEVDESGKVTRTSRFEVVFIVKKFKDFYKQEFAKDEVKLKTEEVVE